MGRELRRVALRFDWPRGLVWSGYLNPYPPTTCEDCHGTGLNADTRRIADHWDARRGDRRLSQADVDALLAADRLWDLTRVPLDDDQREIVRRKIAHGGNSWLPFPNGRRPTADEVNAACRANPLLLDSTCRWICVRARAEREGVLGDCPACGGDGHVFRNARHRARHDAWRPTEPPRGRGFQLWETTSEGAPVSPVFKTLDALCAWCADNATTFGSARATKDEWLRMLSDGLVYHREGNAVFL